MKKRNGFVSNSSSSSFIIGVAVVPSDRVADVEKSGVGSELIAVSEILDGSYFGGWSWRYNEKRDEFSVESFDCTTVYIHDLSKVAEKDPNAKILVLDECGNEPEWNDDADEYNYDDVDMDEEWFSDNQLEAASLIDELGGDVNFGAGFNG